jgi:hypothetical protein
MAQDSAIGGSGGVGDPAASVRQSTDDISRGLHALQEAQRTARRQTLLMVVVIVILTLVFVFGTLQRLRQNFESARLQEAAQKRLPDIASEVKLKLMDVGVAVAPTYQEVGYAKFQEIRPQLEENLAKSMDGFRDEVVTEAKKRMESRLNGIMKRLEPDLQAAFPDLTEAQKVHLVERFEAKLHAQNDEMLAGMQKMITDEAMRLDQALDGFDINKLTAHEKEDLEWQFMHLLVKLVDRKMVEMAPKSRQSKPASPTADAQLN